MPRKVPVYVVKCCRLMAHVLFRAAGIPLLGKWALYFKEVILINYMYVLYNASFIGFRISSRYFTLLRVIVKSTQFTPYFVMYFLTIWYIILQYMCICFSRLGMINALHFLSAILHTMFWIVCVYYNFVSLSCFGIISCFFPFEMLLIVITVTV